MARRDASHYRSHDPGQRHRRPSSADQQRASSAGPPLGRRGVSFLPVHVTDDPARDGDGRIEIVLADGRRVRITGPVSRETLTLVRSVLVSASSLEPEHVGAQAATRSRGRDGPMAFLRDWGKGSGCIYRPMRSPWPIPRPDANAVDGIVFDGFGNPVAYYVLHHDPGDTNAMRAGRVAYDVLLVESVIHLFGAKRPGQSRGIPKIAPVRPLFAMLRRYTLPLDMRQTQGVCGAMRRAAMPRRLSRAGHARIG